MPQRSSTSRYILTALAIILVITAFVLVGLNALQLQKNGGGLGLSLLSQSTDQAYKDGYLAARAKYQSICPLPAATPLLVGSVVSNDGSLLHVQQHSLDTDPKVDGIDDVRTVTLSASTTIMQVTRKTPEQIASEQTAGSAPPSVYDEKSVHLSDIQPGMTITVQSTGDVRLASTIPAISIIISQ